MRSNSNGIGPCIHVVFVQDWQIGSKTPSFRRRCFSRQLVTVEEFSKSPANDVDQSADRGSTVDP